MNINQIEERFHDAIDLVREISPFHYRVLTIIFTRVKDFVFPGTDMAGWGRMCYNPSTNRVSIDITPKCLEMDLPEVAFILMHEVEHLLRRHVPAPEGYQPMPWNYAADVVINEDLLKGEFSQYSLEIARQVLTRDTAPWDIPDAAKTAEAVYKSIPEKKMPKGGGQGQGGEGLGNPQEGPCSGGDIHIDEEGKGSGEGQGDKEPEEGDSPYGGSSGKEKYEEENDKIPEAVVESTIREIVRKLSKGRSLTGIPGRFKNLWDEQHSNKVDWKRVLQMFFTKVRPDLETTWSRINNRRYVFGEEHGIKLITPGFKTPRKPDIFVAVDTSGSCSGAIPFFIAEINNLLRETELSIDGCFIDTNMFLFEEVEEVNEEFKDKVRGGGGTEFTPMYKHLTEGDKQYDHVIIMTDSYVNKPNKKLSTGRTLIFNIGEEGAHWPGCEVYDVDIDS